MEHTIKFQTRSWEDAIIKISKKMKDNFYLEKITTTKQCLYSDEDIADMIVCYEIEMIKYEKEN